jgi:hypothetical protein
VPARGEQVAHQYLHTALGQHGVDLGLAAAAQPDQLRPVADQLPQLPGGRRGDPRLGQPAHPQQIGQVERVAFVVLDPPILERLHSQRMSQVRVRTLGGDHIGRPVPAISGLQHHLRGLPGPTQHIRQPVGVVDNPRGLQHLPGLGHPHDHAAAPVQVDTHELGACVLFHLGPPSS